MIAAAAAASAPRSPVTLNVFPGGFNWPPFAALDKGFFAANGLEVTLQSTPNSVSQMTGLANGAFDISITAVDNIVAYVEGRGEAPIGPQPDFFAFMGSDNGFLSLVARPEIKCIDDLKGKTLSVDARNTGYTFVLLEMLRRGGLAKSD
jgi:ABC-type nitrate/sulfonate/bicarbonate transport system substrate-binding protein